MCNLKMEKKKKKKNLIDTQKNMAVARGGGAKWVNGVKRHKQPVLP